MEKMMAKVVTSPGNIEDLKTLREYLAATPDEVAMLQVWGPAQHGLYSNQMALITSDCDAISILDHQMALSTSDCDAMQGLINEVQDVTKELEACQYDVADDDFARMYEAILWPGKLGGAVESVTLELEALENRFLAEMEGEQVEFERALDNIEVKVNDFSKHTDLGKVVKISAEAQVRGPQHGLSSNKMALITSDGGAMCSPSIKWP